MDQGLNRQNLASLKQIAVDETSARRGHHYLTMVMDSETRRVVFATPGKDAATMKAFGDHLQAHGGCPEQIQEYCSDMSAAFMRGMADVFPQAQYGRQVPRDEAGQRSRRRGASDRTGGDTRVEEDTLYLAEK